MAKILDLASLDAEIGRLRTLGVADLRREWARLFKKPVPPALTKDLLRRMMAYRLQEQVFGGLDRETRNLLDRLAQGKKPKDLPQRLKPGTVLVRDYRGTRHEVMIIREGFVWRGTIYTSLSAIAGQITGTTWNGRRFFGIDRLLAQPLGTERVTPASAKPGEKIAASPGAHDASGAPLSSAQRTLPAATTESAAVPPAIESTIAPPKSSRRAPPAASAGLLRDRLNPKTRSGLEAPADVEAGP